MTVKRSRNSNPSDSWKLTLAPSRSRGRPAGHHRWIFECRAERGRTHGPFVDARVRRSEPSDTNGHPASASYASRRIGEASTSADACSDRPGTLRISPRQSPTSPRPRNRCHIPAAATGHGFVASGSLGNAPCCEHQTNCAGQHLLELALPNARVGDDGRPLRCVVDRSPEHFACSCRVAPIHRNCIERCLSFHALIICCGTRSELASEVGSW